MCTIATKKENTAHNERNSQKNAFLCTRNAWHKSKESYETVEVSEVMPTSCNAKPQRGVTMVLEVSSVPLGRAASRFNGWYKAARKKRAFRYATLNPCRVPTARYP